MADLKEKVASWRQEGKRIGFTNGCFDLLHPGHLSLLNQARAACDCLVVGVNTDQSIRRLKGESRPIMDQSSRVLVLNALSCVDAVILFDEQTPLNLIKVLEPDVLIKGADYTVETVVGADEVLKRGGEVLLAKLQDGFSTTNIVKKLTS